MQTNSVSGANMLLNSVGTISYFMNRQQLDAVVDNYPVIKLQSDKENFKNSEFEYLLNSTKFNQYDTDLLSRLIGQDASEFSGNYVHIIAN